MMKLEDMDQVWFGILAENHLKYCKYTQEISYVLVSLLNIWFGLPLCFRILPLAHCVSIICYRLDMAMAAMLGLAPLAKKTKKLQCI